LCNLRKGPNRINISKKKKKKKKEEDGTEEEEMEERRRWRRRRWQWRWRFPSTDSCSHNGLLRKYSLSRSLTTPVCMIIKKVETLDFYNLF
jgi:hypothetical protein